MSDGSINIASYKIIYLLLGGLAILVGIAVTLILPNDVATARFLREEERAIAIQRMRGVEHGTGRKESYGQFQRSEIPVLALC